MEYRYTFLFWKCKQKYNQVVDSRDVLSNPRAPFPMPTPLLRDHVHHMKALFPGVALGVLGSLDSHDKISAAHFRSYFLLNHDLPLKKNKTRCCGKSADKNAGSVTWHKVVFDDV